MARKTKRPQHRTRGAVRRSGTRRRNRKKSSIKGGGLLDYIWPGETKGPPTGKPPPGALSAAALGRAAGNKAQSFVMPPPPSSEQIADSKKMLQFAAGEPAPIDVSSFPNIAAVKAAVNKGDIVYLNADPSKFSLEDYLKMAETWERWLPEMTILEN